MIDNAIEYIKDIFSGTVVDMIIITSLGFINWLRRLQNRKMQILI